MPGRDTKTIIVCPQGTAEYSVSRHDLSLLPSAPHIILVFCPGFNVEKPFFGRSFSIFFVPVIAQQKNHPAYLSNFALCGIANQFSFFMAGLP